MAKISLADNASGTSPDEFTYNPSEIDAPQARLSGAANSVETIDGESITFYPYLDSRRGSMRWRGYPADGTTTLSSNFNTQISMMQGYIGTDCWMHFQDISADLNIYTAWTKVKIIAVNVTLRSGGGRTYDPVELVWENAEA